MMQDETRIDGPGATSAAQPKPASRKGAPPGRHDVLGVLAPPPRGRDGKKAGKKRARAKTTKPESKKRTRRLSFRVPAELRRSFKRAARAQQCGKGELFARILADWTARHAG